MTTNELKKLYNATRNDERLRLLIETISKTGIRVSEVQYITVGALKNGKAEIDNKGKIRTILIPRKLCVKLLDYHCHKNISCIGGLSNCMGELHDNTCTGELYEPIFTTRTGKPLDRKQIWQMMKNLADKAGVPKEKVFPHNLRHLFAREFYRQTHDIVKLASILGHSSIETTRIYTKETEDECRIELERLSFVRACFSLIVPGLNVLEMPTISSMCQPSFPTRRVKGLRAFSCRYGTARKRATMMAVKSLRSFASSFSQSITVITK